VIHCMRSYEMMMSSTAMTACQPGESKIRLERSLWSNPDFRKWYNVGCVLASYD